MTVNRNVKEKQVKSPIPWPGGKQYLCKPIVERIPVHETYVEPFFGSGKVFFKKKPSRCEVANDLNGDLVNFFEVIKNKPYQFLLEFQFELVSRQLFTKYKAKMAGEEMDLSDLERAKLFFFLVKQSFASMMQTFGTGVRQPPRLNLVNIEEIIVAAHTRLKRAIIENLDWRKLFPKYDRPDTLFFCDPPYLCETSNRIYKSSMGVNDFHELKGVLNTIQGMFIMTLNDHPTIREIFKDFYIEEVDVVYSMNKDGNKKATELIISNYDTKLVRYKRGGFRPHEEVTK